MTRRERETQKETGRERDTDREQETERGGEREMVKQTVARIPFKLTPCETLMHKGTQSPSLISIPHHCL